MTMSTLDHAATLETIAETVGREHGKNAGSWVVDGNTTADRARAIVDGFDAGDPAITDLQPSPLSGEWADGLTESAVINEIAERASYLRPVVDATRFGQTDRDNLLDSFESGYSEGFWDEVIRAAKAILPATVRDVLAAADYDATTSSVARVATVQYSTSMLAHRNGSFVESRDVLVFSDAKIDDRQADEDPMYISNYRALDAMDGWSELRCASPYSNATYFALEMDADAPEGLIDVIRALENYPVLDEALMSEVELELGQEHWDDYGRRDARVSLVAAVADALNANVVDVDLDDVFGDVDVDELLNDRVATNDRYPEYVDPSWFEFHTDDIAAEVIADMRAWLTAEANHGQGELF